MWHLRRQWRTRRILSWFLSPVPTPAIPWYAMRSYRRAGCVTRRLVCARANTTWQNWSSRRKYIILSVLCLASFSGAIAPLSGQLNLGDQEKLYHKTKLQESYAVCSRTYLQTFYRTNMHVELGCSGRYGRRAILFRAYRPPSGPQLGHLLVCALEWP